MFSFVRPSKFRHVYGTAYKRDECYENLRIALGAWDTNFVSANPKYIAANWNSGGGGAFCVVPLENVGKLRGDFPLFTAHAGAVLDTQFSPFNDDIIASAAEDHNAMVWKIPGDLVDREENVTEPLVKLPGHGRKVGHVAWNPVAENVLAVSSSDYTIKIWDIEDLQNPTVRQELKGFKDNVLSMAWNYDGSLLAATCRDKMLRVFDARSGQIIQKGNGHQGVKGSRVTWLGKEQRLATTGFARSSDRELYLWDAQDLSKPISKTEVDLSSGMLMPFYDSETNVLYVAGKGDGNIRYYEYDSDKLHFLSEYQSPEPQRGIGALPKRGVDVRKCEVMRFFKVASDSIVEPISFRVPRKSESFQADIFPPAHAGIPALSAKQYFDGMNAAPITVDMSSVFDNGPVVVDSETEMSSIATVTPAAPIPAPERAQKAAPASVPASSPAPALESTTASVPEPLPAKNNVNLTELATTEDTDVVMKEAEQSKATPTPIASEEPTVQEEPQPPSLENSQVSVEDTNKQQKASVELQNQIKEMSQKYKEAAEKIASLESQMEEVSQSNIELVQANKSADEKLNESSDEIGRLKEEANMAISKAKVAEDKLKAELADRKSISVELEQKIKLVDELRKKLLASEQKVMEKDEMIGSLKAELDATVNAANTLVVTAEKAAESLSQA